MIAGRGDGDDNATMPRLQANPPTRSPAFDKLTAKIVKAWPSASSITAKHELGRLLDRLLSLPHDTTRSAVLLYVAGQITKAQPSHPAKANYLQRIHRFGAEWDSAEARLLGRSGIPWRYVVRLLPYRHQMFVAQKSGRVIPINVQKLSQDLHSLTKCLKPGPANQTNTRTVQAWLLAHQNRLARRSKIKVGIRELAHANRAIEALNAFLGRAMPLASRPISLQDRRAALASVRTIKTILRRLP